MKNLINIFNLLKTIPKKIWTIFFIILTFSVIIIANYKNNKIDPDTFILQKQNTSNIDDFLNNKQGVPENYQMSLTSCIQENEACVINSGTECCEGYICLSKKGVYSCQKDLVQPTPTPTPLCGGVGSYCQPTMYGCNSGETDLGLGRGCVTDFHCCDPSAYVAPTPTMTCQQICGGNLWSTSSPVQKTGFQCTTVSTHHGEVTDGSQCFCAVCYPLTVSTPTPTPKIQSQRLICESGKACYGGSHCSQNCSYNYGCLRLYGDNAKAVSCWDGAYRCCEFEPLYPKYEVNKDYIIPVKKYIKNINLKQHDHNSYQKGKISLQYKASGSWDDNLLTTFDVSSGSSTNSLCQDQNSSMYPGPHKDLDDICYVSKTLNIGECKYVENIKLKLTNGSVTGAHSHFNFNFVECTPPTPTPTPTPTPKPTPTPIPLPKLSCSMSNRQTETINVGDTLNISSSVGTYGRIYVAKVEKIGQRLSTGSNIKIFKEGSNNISNNFVPTEKGIYVFETNVYNNTNCDYMCSAGSELYKNGTINNCNSSNWTTFGANTCVSDCSKYVEVKASISTPTPTPVALEETYLLGRTVDDNNRYASCSNSRYVYGNNCGNKNCMGESNYSVTWTQGSSNKTISNNECFSNEPRYTFENTNNPKGDKDGEEILVKIKMVDPNVKLVWWSLATTDSKGNILENSKQNSLFKDSSGNSVTGSEFTIKIKVYKDGDYKWNHLWFHADTKEIEAPISCLNITSPEEVMVGETVNISCQGKGESAAFVNFILYSSGNVEIGGYSTELDSSKKATWVYPISLETEPGTYYAECEICDNKNNCYIGEVN